MLLLLTLALTRRLKRTRTTLARCVMIFLFVVEGVAEMAGLSGCGSQSLRTYAPAVTATSSTVKRSFDFILTVE
jgi:hypothetical protein